MLAFANAARISTLLATCAAATAACADPVADFYKGRTVAIIVTSQPGGGYDALSRILARALPAHMPGNPSVVVQNMAGAGGIVGSNYVYGNAPKDGTVLGAPNNNVPFEPLFGTKQAAYDPVKFNWLGTPSIETAMLKNEPDAVDDSDTPVPFGVRIASLSAARAWN